LSPRIDRFLKFPGFLIWIFLAYAWGLWKYAVPFTGDEKVYLSIAMEMRAHSDWLHPWLLNEHSYYKPPFQMWATLLGWKIFGFGIFGAFLPSVLATSIAAFCVGELSQKLFKIDSHSITAPLWFAAAAGTLTYGTTAQMEIWIVALYSAAWVAALRYTENLRARWIFMALFCAGLLSLVKSPLYSVLWVLGFWLYLALKKNGTPFKRASFWIAHFLGTAVGASWFVVIFLTDRNKFLADYLYRETLAKAGGNSSSALHMWGDFSTFCVPFLFIAAYMAGRSMSAKFREQLPFFLGWSALPAVFFSAFPYRTETYLFILVPLVAILMDLPVVNSFAFKITTRLNGLAVMVTGVFVAITTYRAAMISETTAAMLVLLSLSTAALSWKARSNWKSLAAISLALTFMVRMGAIELGTSDIKSFLTESTRGGSLVFYDPDGYIWHEVGLLSVAAGKPGIRARSLEEFSSALKAGALGVLSDGDWPTALPFLQSQPQSQDHFLVTTWWRWKRSFQGTSIAGHREYKLIKWMSLSDFKGKNGSRMPHTHR
jgi:4-amino-4-deoxy-L-arabinose transferase-like glycosyltransferase